ncbi:MAG TPA: NTP transferase domain-containing protein [Myxococcaceae bacterium]|nr:NTP transferase domain-containing protein [Myxococcaceae bacterium]
MPLRPLHVLMPMAGLGSRFSEAGFTTPKPLIPVDGMPMFLKALSSLDGWDMERVFTVVLRRQHETEFQLGTLLQKHLPSCRVVLLENMTRGAVETCLAAEHLMEGSRGLLVMDCDLWFRSLTYRDLVRASLEDKDPLSGGLLTFEAKDARYSYAQLEGGRVVRTAEKQVISDSAITGAYYFATEQHFLRVAKALMARNLSSEMKEYYLSLLYNLLLAEGGQVKAARVESFASFGTPEELRRYEARQG